MPKRSFCFLVLVLFSCLPVLTSAQSLYETVSRMAKVSSSYSPSFSPDGKVVAFISDLTGTPQVWMIPAEGGFPIQITDLADTVGRVEWSPDGEWLAVSAAPGGGMNQQIYLVSPDGLTVKRVTNGGRETNNLGPWQKDGNFLAYSSNLSAADAITPYLYSLEDDAHIQVTSSEGISNVVDVHPSGDRILTSMVEGRGSNNLYLIDVDSGNEVLLTPHNGPGSFAGRFSSDGERIFVAHNRDRDRMGFSSIDIATANFIEFTDLAQREDAELEGFQVGPQGRRVALSWNVGGRSELELLDLLSQSRAALDLPVDIVKAVTFSRDGSQLAVVGGGAAAPSDIYIANLDTNAINKITSSPHPGVDLANLVRPELVKFDSHDGLELSGWLYRPIGVDQPAAYVLSFHGGPEGQERPRFNSVYQAILSQGIGVFAPNIRGSSGFGKRFVNLDNQELRFEANKDIAASAEFLVSEGIADRGRLGIMGGSYGGYAVMVAVTEFPDLFAAGVNLFGMVNFETFFENTEPWMAAISGTEYGDPITQQDLLQELSPIYKLDRVKTPLLVQHGANDTNVPVIEAEQVVNTLRQRDVPVKYVLFDDEGHGFRKAPNRVTSQVETVEWFINYLK